MTSKEIVWKVPESLYHELEWAQQELAYPTLADFVTQAVKRYLAEIHHETWRLEFRQLQKQIRSAGGFGLGYTKKEVMANLRKQRLQIYETEYAHLYR
jgi:hypothetical protein